MAEIRHTARRYDLDWLRVLLFGLLVPYHVGFGFIGYGSQVYGFTNDILAGRGLEIYLDWSHSWRLPALFMISGIGCYFVLDRRSFTYFLKQRAIRLVMPLLFASLFLNWTMELATLWAKGSGQGLGRDLTTVLTNWFLSPTVKHVMHLWFLVNLAIYSLVALPLFAHLLRRREQLHPLIMLLVIGGTVFISMALKKPFDKGFFGQGYEFLYYFVFFIMGFWMMTQGSRFWTMMKDCRWVFLSVAIMCFYATELVPEMLRYAGVPHSVLQSYELGGWMIAGQPFMSAPSLSLTIIASANAFFWCMAIFAFAAQYLNRNHPLLGLLNRWVYPFYIVHLPVTFFGFVLVVQSQAHWAIEFGMLSLGTFAVTGACVWLADQVPQLQVLFGMTPQEPSRAAQAVLGRLGFAPSRA
jgi:hypothetical protein